MHTAKILIAAAFVLAACGGDGATDGSASIGVDAGPATVTVVDSPDGTDEAAFAYVKNRRVSSFMLQLAPPEQLAGMKADWAKMQKQPIEAAQFVQMMSTLTADGAEETLFEMARPHLAKAQQQLGMIAGMAPMMAAGPVREAGAPGHTLAIVESLGGKIARMDVASEDRCKQAIAILCKAARQIDVPNGAAMQRLSFEAALGKVDIAYGALVDAFDVYGLNFESTFDSIEAEVLSTGGDTAEVEVTVSLFGFEPQTVPMMMEPKGGRWYPKKDEVEAASGSDAGMVK